MVEGTCMQRRKNELRTGQDTATWLVMEYDKYFCRLEKFHPYKGSGERECINADLV